MPGRKEEGKGRRNQKGKMLGDRPQFIAKKFGPMQRCWKGTFALCSTKSDHKKLKNWGTRIGELYCMQFRVNFRAQEHWPNTIPLRKK